MIIGILDTNSRHPAVLRNIWIFGKLKKKNTKITSCVFIVFNELD